MSLSEDCIEFFKRSNELVDHSHSMEMATNYKANKFNYNYYSILLMNVLKEIATDEEIKKIYPRGINL